MVFGWNAAHAYYQEMVASDIYLAFINKCRSFFGAINIFQIDVPSWEREYLTEADLPAQPVANVLYPDDTGGSPPVTSLLEVGYNAQAVPSKAYWQLTEIDSSYVDHKNEKLASQMADPRITNLKLNLEQFGRKLIIQIVNRSSAPAADEIGGIAANLAGFNNTTPAKDQGYNATILGQQTVPINGEVWALDQTAAGYAMGSIWVLDEMIQRLGGECNAFLVPARFVKAQRINMNKRGITNVDYELALYKLSDADYLNMRVSHYNGVPLIAIPDEIYSMAGHNMVGPIGGADYDIYAIRNSKNDPFDGCSLVVNGEINPDDEETVTVKSDTMNLGIGITLIKGGLIANKTGVVMAKARALSCVAQFCVGDPQAAAIGTGVTD